MRKDYTVEILIVGLLLLLVLPGAKCDNTPPPTPCEARKCPDHQNLLLVFFHVVSI
jgi:hypothetical protein